MDYRSRLVGSVFLTQMLMAVMSLMLCISPCLARADNTSRFDLPAEPMDKALRDFAVQAKCNISYKPGLVAGLGAPAIKGDYTPADVLNMMLKGTRLHAVKLSEDTVEVLEIPTPLSKEVGPSPPGPNSPPSADAPADQSLSEIVVTGTNITGVDNKTLPTLIFDRDSIERSGYSTTEDFMATIPQNYKSGTNSADGVLAGGAGLNNMENSAAANLRGLGASSTLTLLDGHRIAPSAYGTGVDLSMIPLSAIERIEVLTDGSSAVYGSDAVGGVVNVILRKDFNGAETGARLDTLARGGGEQKQFNQSLGKTWGSGGALFVFRFEDDNVIAASQRDFTAEIPEPTDVYPSSKRYSGVFNGHQTLSDSLETFGDALIEHYDAFRSYTTSGEYGQSQLLTSKTNSDSANLGFRWQPFGDWHLEGDTLFSQLDTLVTVDYTPAYPGYINGEPFLRNLFTIKEFDLKFDGTLWSLGGASVKGAAGASYRREDFSALYPYIEVNQPLSRRVSAEFAELYAPVISSSDAILGIRKLELSAAVRRDAYSDFGDKADPRVGVFWSPIDPIGIRASYSTSFRAPGAPEEASIAQANTVYIESGLPFPNGTTGNAIFYGNRVIGPETSRNLTLGLDFSPPPLPGTRFSFNYYRIVYANRLVDISAGNIFANPQVYGPLITNFANEAAVAAFIGALYPPQPVVDITSNGTGLAGVTAAFPYGFINASKEITSGFDANAHSQLNLSGKSKLIFDLSATYIRQISATYCDTCTSTDLDNTYGQPLKLRARSTAGWSDGTWSTNVAANYQNAYTDTNVEPLGHIASWTTADFNVNYRLPRTPVVTVGLAIINVFNASPPRTAPTYNQVEYDAVNADPRGRAMSLQVRVQL
jgi:iron complex outermembrane recepter protein